MGLILDLAVAVLALVVVGSLALLAWTFAVSAVRAIHQERARIARARASIADAEARLRAAARRMDGDLRELAARNARTAQGESTDR